MPRRSRPWFRSDRSMWYSQVGGKQVALHVTDPNDEPTALAALKRIIDEHLAAKAGSGRVRTKSRQAECPGGDKVAGDLPQTVADVVAAFLADAKSRVKPLTLKGYEWYLGQFLARFGSEIACQLDPKRIEADARRTDWSNTTRANYIATIATCLKFAGVELPLRKPPRESAGADTVIPERDYRRMLTMVQGDWPGLLALLWETGCRPAEARAATIADVDATARVIRLKDHKTAGHTGRPRIIHLNDAAWSVVERQVERYRDKGPLFRNCYGRPITSAAIDDAFGRISAKLGRRVRAYGLRHSFATRALASGESDTVVAALLGHANTTMVHKHYSHVSSMGRELQEAAKRIGRTGSVQVNKKPQDDAA